VVEYAHQHDVTVEGELGVLAGIEDDVVAAKSIYTQPDDVEKFVKATGVDSLAISIGTSHGAYKFKPAQCTRNAKGVLEPPPLRFDILDEIEKRIPGFPIVLHGASSVVLKYVEMIKQVRRQTRRRGRIPEEQLRRAAGSAVCKINIDSDGRLAMTALIRKALWRIPRNSIRASIWARRGTSSSCSSPRRTATCSAPPGTARRSSARRRLFRLVPVAATCGRRRSDLWSP